MDFHHPLFQAVALPLLLSLAAAGLFRRLVGAEAGHRWAASAVPLALVVTWIWIVGWHMPPGTVAEKLPYVALAAALLGLALEDVKPGTRGVWFAASLLWALTMATLGAEALAPQAATWVVGALMIRALLSGPGHPANAPAVLVVASLGLAAAAMTAGSALLFELSLALAAAVAGCALWLWPTARIAFGASGLVVAMVAWLALAQAVALTSPMHPAVLPLLACAFLAVPIVRWTWGRRRALGDVTEVTEASEATGTGAIAAIAANAATAATATKVAKVAKAHWTEPLMVAAIAAACVAAALVVAVRTDSSAAAGGDLDNPYYTPRW